MNQLARMAVVAVGMVGLIGTATGGSAQTPGAALPLDPSQFTVEVTNRFFPLTPGSVHTYEGTETDPTTGQVSKFRVEETVLPDPVEIAGVQVLVLQVMEYENGDLIEVTRDYHNQSTDGAIWYFGEDVETYENGALINRDGSWIAGEGENQAGIFIPADPQVFDTMLQERAPGIAEDLSAVIETGVSLSTPAGDFSGCIRTADINPLEVKSEFKHYCPGAGLVREENEAGITELVSIAAAAG